MGCALQPAAITCISKMAMITTLHNEPEFSELFISNLLARDSRIEEDLVDCSNPAKGAQHGVQTTAPEPPAIAPTLRDS